MKQVIKVISDTPEVTHILNCISEILIGAGATLHPDLEIHYKNGNFSCHCPAAIENEYLVRLTSACLIRLEDYQFSINSKQLCATPKNNALSSQQIELMQHVIQLYNISNKLQKIIDNNLLLNLGHNHKIYQHLIGHRPENKNQKELRQLSINNNTDELVIKSFFNTRTFYEKKIPMGRILMPVIDFFNHHPQGASFNNKLDNSPRPTLSIRACHIDKQTDQSYACYGKTKDAMVTFMTYDYAETATDFTYSIPATVEIKNIGQIIVDGNIIKKQKAGHKLMSYLPAISRQSNDILTINGLRIDNRNISQSVELTLRLLIQELQPSLKGRSLEDAVGQAKGSLLKKNIVYYERLLELLQDTEISAVTTQLDILAKHQLAILNRALNKPLNQ